MEPPVFLRLFNFYKICLQYREKGYHMRKNIRKKQQEQKQQETLENQAEQERQQNNPVQESTVPSGERLLYQGAQILVASVIVILLFRFFLPLVLPFCIAGLFALVLYPAARLLRRWLHLPLLAGGSIVLVLFLSSLFIGIFFLGRALINQLIAFFQNFSTFQTYLTEQVGGLCSGCDRIFRLEKGTVMGVLESAMNVFFERVQTNILPALTAKTLQFAAGTAAILGVVLIVLVSTLMMIKDMEHYRRTVNRLKQTPVFGAMLSNLQGGSAAYLRTQLILLSLIALILSFGLFLLRNPYALVLGVGIAVFDAFPLLGSGLVLVPWAVINLLTGHYYEAIVLLILFLICQIIREVLEPKLLSGKLGIRPVSAMMAIYIGAQLFGIAGVLLGPIGLIFVLAIAPEIRLGKWGNL